MAPFDRSHRSFYSSSVCNYGRIFTVFVIGYCQGRGCNLMSFFESVANDCYWL